MPLPPWIEIDTLLRLGVGGFLVLFLWPRYAFAVDDEVPAPDRAVGYVARMLVVLIAAGYVLVAAHIYSWLTLALVLLALRLVKPQPAQNAYELRRSLRLAANLLAELDRLGSWPARTLQRLRGRLRRPRAERPGVPGYLWVGGALVLAVLGVAAYLRLASPLAHASIPFSDSDVVLYWVQTVEQQVLFPNGIYPEGFHIFMADLIRLTVANPIASVKFFGPIVGVAMVASVGFTTYRLTGRFGPAAIAALVYGTLPHLLPYEYLRQVGTDSQEFGNALVLPVLWFVYASWVKPSPWYRGTAVALLLVAAFTHPVVTLNAGAAAVAATVAAWLANGVRWPVLGWYLRWMPVAILAAVAPLVVALLLGIPLNSSGASFLGAATHGGAPPISLANKIALLSDLALILVRLVRLGLRRAERADLGMPLAALLVLLAALAVKEAPLFGIHSVVLASRAAEFIALAEGLAAGIGFSALQEAMELIHLTTARWLAVAAAVAVVAFAWLQYRPQPFDAFRTSRWLPDDFVLAYVDIATSLPHGSWLAVSDDSGFDYTYGQSFFMVAQTFAQHVAPTAPWPRYSGGGTSYPLSESHLFLFVDKRIVVAQGYRYDQIPSRTASQAAIRGWVKAWQQRHGPLPVYYSGPDLTVYQLTAPGSTPLAPLP